MYDVHAWLSSCSFYLSHKTIFGLPLQRSIDRTKETSFMASTISQSHTCRLQYEATEGHREESTHDTSFGIQAAATWHIPGMFQHSRNFWHQCVRLGHSTGHKNSPFYPTHWSKQWESENCFMSHTKWAGTPSCTNHVVCHTAIYMSSSNCGNSIKQCKHKAHERLGSSSFSSTTFSVVLLLFCILNKFDLYLRKCAGRPNLQEGCLWI
jgi:hypothetical protein